MSAPNKGIVKAVVSCDTIIVMGVPQVRIAPHGWRRAELGPARKAALLRCVHSG